MSNAQLADMFLHRPNAPEGRRNKNLGTLFYDSDTDLVTLKLTGWLQGTINGIGKGRNQYPFLQGDLKYRKGTYEREGQTFLDWQWCGFMTTSERDSGETVYTAVLEIQPVTTESSIWLKMRTDDD